MKHSLMGMKSSVGEDLEVPYKPKPGVPVNINLKLPTLFSRSRSNDDQLKRVKKFFEEEKGSVAISQAACSTNRIDLSSMASKTMTLSFIEAVKGLHFVSNDTKDRQNLELKRFINEFGTHYSQQTILGKLTLFISFT